MIRLALTCVALTAGSSLATLINFDDRPGHPPPSSSGTPVAPQYIVDDEYGMLGVLFSSGGGGIRISAPSNPVSGPNVAGATGPGPVVSFTHDVTATFMIGSTLARVDSVGITLTASSSLSFLEAYSLSGAFLGSASGNGTSPNLLVTFPGLIHRVVIKQGPNAFDDFRFEGLVPAPSGLALVALSGVIACRRRRPR